MKNVALALVVAISLACLPCRAADIPLDTAVIERETGLKGQLNEKEGVFKVSYPRTDIQVRVAGVKMTPSQGLTAWAAFNREGNHTMVMGDLVLLEDQVNPVMSAALDNGLEVTALHNHFLWDSPRVMFMHISGMGDEKKLAAAVGAAFTKIKETSGGKGTILQADIDPSRTSLKANELEDILHTKGELAKGAYKFSFGKWVTMNGHKAGNAMGVNTWAAFAGTDDKAVVDGDFVMYESELQGVLKALRHAGIYIAAIHNHMVMESPRVIFLHYWGIGNATDLAKGLRAALDAQR